MPERPKSTTEGTPTWVKAFAIVAVILAIGVVVMLLAGGHGPGTNRHGGLPAPAVGPGTGTSLAPG